ncbi:MaoC/PaaZ C-terminal domain-containing protein [Alkalicoccus daliensis]|uniref:Acyl dehydratase n=1 Tax=Alkalicoccus daliensis TaxID=745820 RepID=A0A1H0CDI3_9BACI|nr:MaoC/PaaZ C-terminal domain-containing protein [Alkalicoccus daliensis]SDN55886.1 Acyl dehydratase [Alkalicoccus daliensis]
MFSKRKRLGKLIEEVKSGDTFIAEYKIKDKDILLYLGFSDDSNPAYIQHDYAARTPYKRPIVPQLMLTGYITSAVSMHLPGPGSVMKEQNIRFLKPMYHYGLFKLKLVVTEVNKELNEVTLDAEGLDEYDDLVLTAKLIVTPPYPWKPMTEETGTFENF